MLKTLRNAFKINDIRKKLLYTFAMLVVIRIGSQLPIPGVETAFFKDFFAQQNNDAFGFFNAMTGSSFTNMSVFALSITVYHFLHYYAASDHCDSEAGRDAERR